MTIQTAGPISFQTIGIIVLVWIIVSLIISIVVYVRLVPKSKDEATQVKNARNIQLWIGNSGFIGTIVTVAAFTGIVLALLYTGYYFQLMAHDVKQMAGDVKDFGNQVVAIANKSKIVDEFFNLYKLPK